MTAPRKVKVWVVESLREGKFLSLKRGRRESWIPQENGVGCTAKRANELVKEYRECYPHWKWRVTRYEATR